MGIFTKIFRGTVANDDTGTDLRTGGDYVNENFDKAVARIDSVEDIEGLTGDYDGQQISMLGWHPDSDIGGGKLYWDSGRAKSDHNGGTVFSPTVPWSLIIGDYLDGIGETDPSGNGVWVRFDKKSNKIINIRHFGAIGDASTNPLNDDTAAIDAAIDLYDSLGYEDGESINGSRDIFLVTDAPVFYAPAGNYNYNGAGYVPSNNKVFVLRGDSPASSMISIQSDVHFCNPQNSSRVMAYVEVSDIKINGGRGVFFNEKTNVGNVAQGKRLINSALVGYTSVAFGSVQLEDARWFISASWFDGGNTGTPVGLALPHEVAELDISGCQFGGNKYDIVTYDDGMSEQNIGPNNSFFRTAGSNKEANIWFLPGDGNQGTGVKVSYNRFSNENLDGSKPTFLVADRDNTTASHVFTHSTAVSSNNFSEVEIAHNSIASNGNPEATDHIAYILSYTPSIKGWRFSKNRLTQWRPRLIDFAAGITEQMLDDAGAGISNLFEINNQNVGNNYNIIALSNLKGAGFLKTDDYSRLGFKEQISAFSDEYDVTNLTFTSNIRGSLKGANVTETNILDSQGGTTAAEYTYGADENVVLINGIDTNGIAGKTGWIEFEVKRGSSNSLNAIQLDIQIQSKITSYSLSLTDEWQKIRVPFIYSTDVTVSSEVQFRLTPALFLEVGVKDTFAIGRKVIYHSCGPVPYDVVAI